MTALAAAAPEATQGSAATARVRTKASKAGPKSSTGTDAAASTTVARPADGSVPTKPKAKEGTTPGVEAQKPPATELQPSPATTPATGTLPAAVPTKAKGQ